MKLLTALVFLLLGTAFPRANAFHQPFDIHQPTQTGKFAVGSTTVNSAFGKRWEIFYPSKCRNKCRSDCCEYSYELNDGNCTASCEYGETLVPHVYSFSDDYLNASTRAQVNAPLPLTCDCFRHAPPAYGSFPVVIYAHGTSQTRLAVLGWAEHLASRGVIVASFDNLAHFGEIGLNPSLDENVPAFLDAFGLAEKNTSMYTDAVVFDGATTILAMCATIRGGGGFPGSGLPAHMFSNETILIGHSLGTAMTAVAGLLLPVRPSVVILTGGVDTFPVFLPMPVNQRIWLQGHDDTVPVSFEVVKAGYDASPPRKRFLGVDNAGHMFTTSLCSDDLQAAVGKMANEGVDVSPFWQIFIQRECHPFNTTAISFERGQCITKYAFSNAIDEGLFSRCSCKAINVAKQIFRKFSEVLPEISMASPMQKCPTEPPQPAMPMP